MLAVRDYSALQALPALPVGSPSISGRPVIRQPESPLRLSGDQVAIQGLVEENGITAVIRRDGYLVLGRSQAQEARRLLQHCGKALTRSGGAWRPVARHAQSRARLCADSFTDSFTEEIA